MTDKEQIIIDGVDVSRCVFYQIEANKLHPKAQYCGSMRNIFCEDEPNCYFKQLARKTQECEELKKANLHIDTNRQSKGSKLKRIEELISACEAGYTDEFIQKIYGIIQEPEPAINDYSITDRYRKALEEIKAATKINCEEICGRKFADCNDTSCLSAEVLDIINKAKGEE